MRIFDNGIVRDMTEEEEAVYQTTPPPGEGDIPAEEALDILMGVSE